MSVLSIDPGIKNLGVCLLDSDKSVLYWEVINILSGEDSNQKKECNEILKSKKKCKVSANWSNNSLYYCKRHAPENSVDVNPLVKFCSNEELCKKILAFVKKFAEDNYNIEYIIIEDQKKSTDQIKFTSSCLFSFFCLYYPEAKINFIPAKYKLMVYKGDKVWDNVPEKRYAKNKFLGIKYCQEIIKDDEKLIEHTKTYNKLDDLADCFCTAIYFIDNKFTIPTFVSKKSKFKRKYFKSKKSCA